MSNPRPSSPSTSRILGRLQQLQPTTKGALAVGTLAALAGGGIIAIAASAAIGAGAGKVVHDGRLLR